MRGYPNHPDTRDSDIEAKFLDNVDGVLTAEDARKIIEQVDALDRLAAEIVTRPQMSDMVFTSARQFLTEREVVELLHLCGYYWTLSRVCTVLEVDLTQLYAQVSVDGFPTGGNPSTG